MKNFTVVYETDNSEIYKSAYGLNIILELYQGSTSLGAVRVKELSLPYEFAELGYDDKLRLKFDAANVTVDWEWVRTSVYVDEPLFEIEFDVEELGLHQKWTNRTYTPTIEPANKIISWSDVTDSYESQMDVTNVTIAWVNGSLRAEKSITLPGILRPGRMSVSMEDKVTAGTQTNITYSFEGYKFSSYLRTYINGKGIESIKLDGHYTSVYWTPSLSLYANELTTQYQDCAIDAKISYSLNYEPRLVDVPDIIMDLPVQQISPYLRNAAVTDETGNLSIYGSYVANQSKYNVYTKVHSLYGATITDILVEACGETYNASFRQTSDQGSLKIVEINPHVITEKIRSTSDNTMKITATDSRGLTVSQTIQTSVLDWFTPMLVNAAVHRGRYSGGVFTPDDDGNYVKIEWSVKFAPVNNRNSRQLKITAPDGQHTESLTAYEQSGYRISAASTESSYSIVFTLTDSFATFVRTISLSTAGVAMDILRGGNGLGLGKVAELEDTLDVNPEWNVRVYGMTLAEYIEHVVGQMNT